MSAKPSIRRSIALEELGNLYANAARDPWRVKQRATEQSNQSNQ
jgi:hypothetical protein